MAKSPHFINYGRWQRILIAALCIALASQINIPLETPGFILAMSPLLLPAFLYFNKDLNPIQLTAVIALASPIFRGVMLAITHSSAPQSIVVFVLADIVYFGCYGVLYYALYWRRGQWTTSGFFLTILVCDYLANVFEISLLQGFTGYTYQEFQVLFMAALVRSSVACFIAFLYHYFTLLVRKEDHEQRYYHFMWIAASVNSEVYFMKKSIAEIEAIMKDAYLLNQHLQQADSRPADREMALNIALNVHEIKKNYQNVIRGLDDYFDADQDAAMKLTDIFKVVVHYIRQTIQEQQRDIVVTVQSEAEAVVPNHYYLVSILSNLMFNALDAMATQSQGTIRLAARDTGGTIIIRVSDTGSGMAAATVANIFQPGFTTKYNESTGDMYRGLGLSRVRAIVEEQFGGTIEVASTVGQGTTFTLTLNKGRLEQEAAV